MGDRRPLLLLALLALLLAPLRTLADVLILSGGGRIEGRIVSQDDQVIKIETANGVVQSVYRDEVARIEKTDPAVEAARKKAIAEENARRAAEDEAERKVHEAEREAEREAEAARAKDPTKAKPAEGAPRAHEVAVGGGAAVTVVQLNLRFDFETDGENRWAKRVPLVAGLLADAKAEVACFQEDKTDQVDDLRKVLPGWEFVGMGRNGGMSEHCSVSFDTRRWRCGAHGDFWLSDTPEKVGSNTWGTKYPHKVTWARLESATDHEGARRECVFLSTHLDEHPELDEVRQKSVKVIRAWISQHAAGANVILCGDFNAGTDEKPHAVMTDPLPAPKLVECWDELRKTDPNTGTCHEFKGKAGKKRIDWMLCAGNVKPVEIQIDRWNKDGRYPSDHFALVGKLEIGHGAGH